MRLTFTESFENETDAKKFHKALLKAIQRLDFEVEIMAYGFTVTCTAGHEDGVAPDEAGWVANQMGLAWYRAETNA